MFMMRLVYGCLFVYATSFAAETQFVPLIPRNLESWSELKAELAAHVSALDSNDDISAYVGTIPWGTDFHDASNPMPPADMMAGDRCTVSYMLRMKSGGWSGAGQLVAWRGKDGRPVGITLWLNRHVLPRAKVFSDDKTTMLMDRLATSATGPDWRIVRENDSWAASWHRPGGQAMDLDGRFGVVPALREIDLAWLSSPSEPTPTLPVMETLPENEYANRIANHDGVQAALKRFQAGYPIHPFAIFIVYQGLQAERLGWKVGDITAEFDNKPIKSMEQIIEERRKQPTKTYSFRLIKEDLSSVVHETSPGRVGFNAHPLAPDYGLAVLRLAGPALIDAAAAWYGCDDPRIAATALQRLTGKVEPGVEAILRAWFASRLGQQAVCERELSHAQIPAELQEVQAEIRASDRTRSGRVVWAKTIQPQSQGSLLRHLLNRQPETDRFLFLARGPAVTWTTSATALTNPLNHPGKVLLEEGLGTLLATNDAPIVEALLGGIPQQCRVDFELIIRPVVLTAPAQMAYSPMNRCVEFGFGIAQKDSVRVDGCGRVRLWIDGSVEAMGPTLDTVQIEPRWLPVPARIVAGRVIRVTMLRYNQMQRIEVDGRAILSSLLPLTDPEAEQSIGVNYCANSLAAVTSAFTVKTADHKAAPSDF